MCPNFFYNYSWRTKLEWVTDTHFDCQEHWRNKPGKRGNALQSLQWLTGWRSPFPKWVFWVLFLVQWRDSLTHKCSFSMRSVGPSDCVVEGDWIKEGGSSEGNAIVWRTVTGSVIFSFCRQIWVQQIELFGRQLEIAKGSFGGWQSRRELWVFHMFAKAIGRSKANITSDRRGRFPRSTCCILPGRQKD